MKITAANAPELIEDILLAKKVPMLTSSPGLGKSDIVRAIAKKFNLKLIDIRLSQCDPTDLNGFPTMNEARTRSTYAPMDTFPLEGDPLPKDAMGKVMAGWFIFYDEMNSAAKAVQAAAYKIILDRMVGQQHLHSKVVQMAAGNMMTDGAIVTKLSTALQSRMIHLEMEIDHKAWLEWADINHVDHRVSSYIAFKPDALYQFKADHDDKTFACPRTWFFMSDIIKGWKNIAASKLPILAGTVGEGAAYEFTGFCEVFGSLPTIDQMLQSPETVMISTEPSVRFALSGLIAANADVNNVDQLIKVIDRLPIEFQVICLQSSLKRTPALKSAPAIRKWISVNAQELL